MGLRSLTNSNDPAQFERSKAASPARKALGPPTENDGENTNLQHEFRPNAPELVGHNGTYATGFHDAELQVNPTRHLVIVSCMDSRIDIFKILGLRNGEAHVIRNAGGVVTDDVIRSLCLSQRFLGTREVMLIHHTDCGLQKVDEGEFRQHLEEELGVKPWWSLEAFSDPYRDVAQSIRRLKMTPFLPFKEHISGYVYDVEDGRLHPAGPTT